MHKPLLLFIAALFLASPVAAAGQTKGTSFGFVNCGQPFPCSNYAGLMSSDPRILTLVSQADSCVTQYFGQRGDGSGSFYAERGLDSSQCLATKPVPKATMGATTSPHCCLTPVSNDACILRCELIGTR